MTEQLILATAIALVALALTFEIVETWRWRGSENRPPSRLAVLRFLRRIPGALVGMVALQGWRSPGDGSDRAMATQVATGRPGQPPGPPHVQPHRIVVSGTHSVSAASPANEWMVAPTAIGGHVPRQWAGHPRARLIRDTLGAALVLVGLVVAFANLLPVKSDPDGGVLAATGLPDFTPVVITPQPAGSPLALGPVGSPATPNGTPAPGVTPAPISTPPGSNPTSGVPPVSGPTTAPGQPPPTNPPPPTPPPPTNPPPTPPPPTPPPTTPPPPTPPPPTPPPPTQAPAPGITSFTGPSNALPLQAVTFSFSFENATRWRITYGDGAQAACNANCGTSGSRTHSYILGSYTVELTVFGAGGSSDAASRTISAP
ncbi:MAG: hypothetical protein ABI628_00490 [Chloroflexota bacterium]